MGSRLRVRFHAGPDELGQQVLADLVPVQGALLVLGALQRSAGRQCVSVEGDPFHMHRPDGRPPPQPVDPREGGVHPVPQAGRQPPVGAGAVGEPGRPVPQVHRPAPTAVSRTLSEFVADLAAPVVELDRLPGPAFTGLLGEHSDPGVSGTGVDTDLDAVHLRGSGGAVLEPDRERGVPGDHGASRGQELAGSGGRTWLERNPVLVEDEHERAGLLELGLTALLPGRRAGGDAGTAR